MRYYSSVYSFSYDIPNGAPAGKRRIISAIPQEASDDAGSSCELEALINGHRRIVEEYESALRDHDPGPYYAVYQTGMVLPYGAHQLETSEAELYAGPFQTWTELQQFVHSNTPLADTAWHWGNAPLAYLGRDEVEKIVAVLGPPPQQPIFA